MSELKAFSIDLDPAWDGPPRSIGQVIEDQEAAYLALAAQLVQNARAVAWWRHATGRTP